MKVRALPTCRKPVGDGAKRTRSITFEYSGIEVFALGGPVSGSDPGGSLPAAGRCRDPATEGSILAIRPGYQWVTEVTFLGKFVIAPPHLIRRYCWKRRAQGGTYRK